MLPYGELLSSFTTLKIAVIINQTHTCIDLFSLYTYSAQEQCHVETLVTLLNVFIMTPCTLVKGEVAQHPRKQ